MKTLLISGQEPVPEGLRELVSKGSTELHEVTADDLRTFISREGFGVDRLVFWAGEQGHDIRTLALTYSTAAGDERRQTVVFVTGNRSEQPLDGMTPEEVFVWPRDEDKLTMVFITGG